MIEWRRTTTMMKRRQKVFPNFGLSSIPLESRTVAARKPIYWVPASEVPAAALHAFANQI